MPDPRSKYPKFDYDTISDLILHLRYTAREGGKALAEAANGTLDQGVAALMVLAEKRGGLYRSFSVRQEFPREWNAFFNQSANADQVLSLALTKERFPYLFQAMSIQITSIDLVVDTADGSPYEALVTPPAKR